MNVRSKQLKGQYGFTLIEMLVVISIIAILAALSIPVIKRAIQTAHRASCASNLHGLSLNLETYKATRGKNAYYPDKTGKALWVFLASNPSPAKAQIKDPSELVCPLKGSTEPAEMGDTPSKSQVDYLGPNRRISDIMDGYTAIASDETDNHPDDMGINVLFTSGKVEVIHRDNKRFNMVQEDLEE